MKARATASARGSGHPAISPRDPGAGGGGRRLAAGPGGRMVVLTRSDHAAAQVLDAGQQICAVGLGDDLAENLAQYPHVLPHRSGDASASRRPGCRLSWPPRQRNRRPPGARRRRQEAPRRRKRKSCEVNSVLPAGYPMDLAAGQ